MKMKKHSIFGSALLSTALLLGACGDKEEVTDAVDSSQAQKEFGFQAFDLDIDTAEHNDAIDASFDIDVSETEAVYENKLESKKLTGNEAYAELEPIFKDLALTKDMSKEDVIAKVSKAFGAENYTEFELEVEFSDGDNQEFLDKK
ncbi:YusW-like protein [Psychrobacillus insolitus]|uniref:YusW-like protein n=2 Tax=Psychrobacillus insolitus TaxID=1461 RepID=A0A2W7MHW1_9BACI|nr:YusW-like protein [Psychrobacillus insolitus]